jgi:hypothetical protein
MNKVPYRRERFGDRLGFALSARCNEWQECVTRRSQTGLPERKGLEAIMCVRQDDPGEANPVRSIYRGSQSVCECA